MANMQWMVQNSEIPLPQTFSTYAYANKLVLVMIFCHASSCFRFPSCQQNWNLIYISNEAEENLKNYITISPSKYYSIDGFMNLIYTE